MRKAASGWEEDYAKKLINEGFRRGIGAPTVFYNEKTQVRLVVHGDDFTFAGVKVELEKMRINASATTALRSLDRNSRARMQIPPL